MAKLIELILTESKIGKGVEGDPIRNVIELWTKNGDLIAACDQWAAAQESIGADWFRPTLDLGK